MKHYNVEYLISDDSGIKLFDYCNGFASNLIMFFYNLIRVTKRVIFLLKKHLDPRSTMV